jgi:Domain of unknown function (DUF3943)
MACCQNDNRKSCSKKATIIWGILLSSAFMVTNGYTQEVITDSATADSAAVVPLKKTNLKRASIEFFAAQALPWCYNRYIRKAEFAKISFNSLSTNLNPAKWEWDDNKFVNNHISHPFHGSLYYNAFRSNGYGFWGSSAGTVAGSLLWEIAWETHYPAPNDLINTSLGGIAVGEMTYRLANAIVKKPHHGVKGHLLESLAFIINPINGFNRLMDHQWNRPGAKQDTGTNLLATADFGVRQYTDRSDGKIKKWRNELFSGIELEYGNPFKNIKKPFGNFSASIESGTVEILNMIRVKGALYGWNIKNTENTKHVANVLFSYDFYSNPAFAYSAESFHLNLVSEYKLKTITARTYIGAGTIALAAVPNAYLYYGEGRNYDYGCGLGIALASRVAVSNKLVHVLQYRRGWFKTVNGFNSSYYLGATVSSIKYRVLRNLFAEFEWSAYFLSGKYKGYSDVTKRYTNIHAALEYSFRF